MPDAAASMLVMPHPSLGDGKQVGPGAPQQMQFFRLAHEAPEAYRALHAELLREVFESWAVGPGPRDIQFDVGPLLSRHGQGPNRNIHALVAPQSPYIKERWRCGASTDGSGRKALASMPGRMTVIRSRGTPRVTRSSRVLSLMAWNPARRYAAGYRPLQQPDQRRHGPRGLLKYRARRTDGE